MRTDTVGPRRLRLNVRRLHAVEGFLVFVGKQGLTSEDCDENPARHH
jgi:hypothetical protein